MARLAQLPLAVSLLSLFIASANFLSAHNPADQRDLQCCLNEDRFLASTTMLASYTPPVVGMPERTEGGGTRWRDN